jgi:mono/diheme cytochrome c family protein
MNLKMFWKTNHWVTFTDGKEIGYCSIHCAAIAHKKKGSARGWKAVDYDSKRLLDARKAFFLIGSDLPGTMTARSKLAFSSREVAQNYQTKHGGTIGTFDDALKQALADLGPDKSMLKKKMAKMSVMGNTLAEKHGCYSCHGPGGSGEKAPSWSSREFAKRMDSRVKIKKQILKGSPGMKGFQGRIPEKELHSIALYVWSKRTK